LSTGHRVLGRPPAVAHAWTTDHPSFLTATKHGYLVSISAMGLSEGQNEQILSTMLEKL